MKRRTNRNVGEIVAKIDLLEQRVLFSVSYSVTDLGTMPSDDNTQIAFVNAAGTVVSRVGTIYSGGTISNISSVVGSSCVLTGISDGGVISGSTEPAGRAFLYSNNQISYLDTAFGIPNAFNVVVNRNGDFGGVYIPQGGQKHLFRQVGGIFSDLGVISGEVFSMSPNDKLAGSTVLGGENSGFLYDTSLHIIPKLPGVPDNSGFGIAYSVNDAGIVAGATYAGITRVLHPFASDGTNIADLEPFDPLSSWGYGINDSGDIVGVDGQGGVGAFIESGGTITPLNNLLSTPGFAIIGAYNFNKNNQIVASALNFSTFKQSRVLLTPKNGGGGGGTGTGITVVINNERLTAQVVGGAAMHGSLNVRLTNAQGTIEKGVTVNVYASLDSSLDLADTLVTSVIKSKTAIRPGKSISVNVPIKMLPASLPDNTYNLIVQTVDSGGVVQSAVASTSVSVAAPFVSLSETVTSTLPAALVSGTKARGKASLVITNNGNVASKGLTTIDITASTTSGVVGTDIASLSRKLNIKAGKSVKVNVPIKTIPALADGNYFLVAKVTDPFSGAVSIGSSAATTTIAAPFITLAGEFTSITPKVILHGASIRITNTGNVDDVGAFTATIGLATDPAGSNILTSSAGIVRPGKLKVKTGKAAKLHVTGWNPLYSALPAGGSYYLTVVLNDAAGNALEVVSTTQV